MARFQALTNNVLEPAARFYERLGFARLGTAFPCRMVLDLAPLVGR